jgi:hypothetical protein
MMGSTTTLSILASKELRISVTSEEPRTDLPSQTRPILATPTKKSISLSAMFTMSSTPIMTFATASRGNTMSAMKRPFADSNMMTNSVILTPLSYQLLLLIPPTLPCPPLVISRDLTPSQRGYKPSSVKGPYLVLVIE